MKIWLTETLVDSSFFRRDTLSNSANLSIKDSKLIISYSTGYFIDVTDLLSIRIIPAKGLDQEWIKIEYRDLEYKIKSLYLTNGSWLGLGILLNGNTKLIELLKKVKNNKADE